MAWLEDYLAGLGQQAAQVGGVAAPVAAQAAQAAGAPTAAPAPAQGPQEGLLELARNYQRYLRRSGHEQDPLAALVGRARGGSAGSTGGAAAPTADAAVRLLTGEGGSPVSLTTHGPRADRNKQSYALGDGRQANVYYDAKGRRQVMVFRPQQQALPPGGIDPAFAAQIAAKDPAALAFVDMVRRRQSAS